MKAYIQKESRLLLDEEKIVIEVEKRNIPIVLFSKKQLLRGKIIVENPYIVCANLDCMSYIFKYLNIIEPLSNSYPKSVINFYGRKIVKSTLREAYIRYKKREDFFIKPIYGFKKFTGFVLSDNIYYFEKLIKKLTYDYPIYISEIVDIKSEYRVYVSKGKIISISLYWGEQDSILDLYKVQTVVNILTSDITIPNAYAIDFFVKYNGETNVLELNEGFGIDSYSSSSNEYFEVIKTRWDELNKKEINRNY